MVFDHALDLAKAKNDESIMIGDSYEADIVGAENAGIRASPVSYTHLTLPTI